MSAEMSMMVFGLVATAIVGVLGWFIKTAYQVIKELLTRILNELQKQNDTSVEHGARITVLEKGQADHETRIRTIEKS